MSVDIDGLVSACTKDLDGIDVAKLIKLAKQDLPPGADEETTYKAVIYTAASLIEREPNYSKVAARVVLSKIERECPYLSFAEYIQDGIIAGSLSRELYDKFPLSGIEELLKHERNNLFNYLGIQTLYDRYLIRHNGVIIEKPQWFWMRVAMGLSLNEKNPMEFALEVYEQISQMNYLPSTPTLFNSGTTHSQLASCYISVAEDSIEGIFNTYKENGHLQKYAGGVANSWSKLRASGSTIKGTGGKSSGIVPYLKIANDVCLAVDQSSRRPGAVCAYLETWHLDIEEFLECRKNTGDDRRRFHDMNTANWIPDLFMNRVYADQEWTLFSTNDVLDLPELYGSEFNTRYSEYEKMAEAGLISNFKKVSAKTLWRKMLSMIYETGHPWLLFKDAHNIRYQGRKEDIIHSSNLCTETSLPTSITETAVCSLSSINLSNHVKDGMVDWGKLVSTVQTTVRALDNSIDLNFYPSKKSEAHKEYRPLGLGMMGWQDMLFMLGMPFDSPEALQLADNITEVISFTAIYASVNLAKERGAYRNFAGSAWDAGKLPIDTIDWLNMSRTIPHTQDKSINTSAGENGWDAIRLEIKKYGIRNSCLMAIAPTATISNISNTYPCIEPAFKNVYVKSNASGDFTVINQYLVEDLKKLGLWNKSMGTKLKLAKGSVQKIKEIPQKLKDLYKTAFEIDQKVLIDQASRRQKWIDQSQSLNLFVANPSGKLLDDLYRHVWVTGCKSSYYLRSMKSSDAGMVTVAEDVPEIKACSIENPECESCQ